MREEEGSSIFALRQRLLCFLVLAHAVVLYSQGGKQQEHSPLILEEDLPGEEEEELWGPYQKRGGATLD